MFNKAGNLENITAKEEAERNRRIESIKKDIEANMRPFSFYDKDYAKFEARRRQECIPPKFVPFKANPIKTRSQVKMKECFLENEKARKERNKKKALELLSKSKLPPRMEMHEKQKNLQKEEEKKIEKQGQKLNKVT